MNENIGLMLILAINFIALFVLLVFTGDLRGALNDYELLHHTAFQHHIRKRDLYSRDPDVREVEYNTFGRLSLLIDYLHVSWYFCCY